MRVFLINPSSGVDKRAGVYSDSMFPMPPLGLAYLAGVSRDLGHETAVEDQYASGIDANQIAELVLRHRADVVGLSCLSPCMPEIESIILKIRGRIPNVHITLGNIHATLFADELIKRLPIDSIVLGEGEETFGELLTCLEKGNSDLSITGLFSRGMDGLETARHRLPIRNLDELPRPAWELFRLEDYMLPPRMMFREIALSVHASRGCPWKCSFCSQNTFMPGVRRRSMRSLVEEMVWIHKDLGVSCVGFQDAIFPLSEDEGFEFCRLMTEHGMDKKMKWFTETRTDLVSFDLLKELKLSGCLFIMYGFESGNVRHLEESGKRLDPQRGFEVMGYMKRLKIPTYGLFMIGFPHETVEEARVTIKYAQELDCDVASFSRVTPYPGTAFFDRYKDTFPTDIFPWQWNNQYRPQPQEAIWQLPGLSHEAISNLLIEAMAGFYFRPRTIIKHLRLGLFSKADMIRGALSILKDVFVKLSHMSRA